MATVNSTKQINSDRHNMLRGCSEELKSMSRALAANESALDIKFAGRSIINVARALEPVANSELNGRGFDGGMSKNFKEAIEECTSSIDSYFLLDSCNYPSQRNKFQLDLPEDRIINVFGALSRTSNLIFHSASVAITLEEPKRIFNSLGNVYAYMSMHFANVHRDRSYLEDIDDTHSNTFYFKSRANEYLRGIKPKI